MKKNIELVNATENDCKYIYDLVCQLEKTTFEYSDFTGNYNTNLSNIDINYFIIKYNHEQCGFISIHTQILLHHNGKIGEIQEFIIEEKFRGKGIGKGVINKVKETCQKNSLVQLEVCTNKNRLETQIFYKNCGFNETHFKYVMII